MKKGYTRENADVTSSVHNTHFSTTTCLVRPEDLNCVSVAIFRGGAQVIVCAAASVALVVFWIRVIGTVDVEGIQELMFGQHS